MLPLLYLAAITGIATLVLTLALRHRWQLALLAAAAGTLSGTLAGSVVGAIIDIATTGGDALLPAGAIGAALGAVGAPVILSGKHRRLQP